ncbi:MAG: hypothetical protein K8R88_06850 [Armatimonadetes bacterium]|nr:hypothetical protein [Armatimonadota bacterium]
MKLARRLLIVVGIVGAAFCQAQIPDLLNSLDAGGRAMGMGGSLYGTGADSHSVLANPAGLGYVTQRQVSLAFRNKPTSTTNASNNFRNPDLATTAGSGDISISHAGYVQPVGKGAIGLSFTTGGFIRDEKSGVGDLVLDAGTSIRNYRELLKANIDFFTASYGAAAGGSPLTWGVGLVVASTFVRNTQSYDLVSGGQANPTTPLDVTGTGTGIGAVAGIQYVPPSKSNLVLGLSVRTPIRGCLQWRTGSRV